MEYSVISASGSEDATSYASSLACLLTHDPKQLRPAEEQSAGRMKVAGFQVYAHCLLRLRGRRADGNGPTYRVGVGDHGVLETHNTAPAEYVG